jgi:hypothetical protein
MKQLVCTVSVALLALTFLRAVESIESEFRSETFSLFSSNACPFSRQADRVPLKLIGAARDDSLVVHASFLLFDFKQNLRQWPNVAGDISRSPPFLRSL